MPAKGKAKGWYSRVNMEGLTHVALPFMFGLTLCGIKITKVNPFGMDRADEGHLRSRCKRCERTELA